MFVSFFPKPKLFFISAAAWSLFGVLLWFFGGRELGATFGMGPAPAGTPTILGVPIFWSGPFVWFYIYFVVMLAAFTFSGASTPRIRGKTGPFSDQRLFFFPRIFLSNF